MTEFIKSRCEWHEFEVWAELVGSEEYSPDNIGPMAGVDPEDIRRAARIYSSGPR